MQSEMEPSKNSVESWKVRGEKRRLKIEEYLNFVEETQSYAFRIFALIFLVGVEFALFIAVFMEKEVGAGLITAITIIAVLPILVIRVFDISVLNLNKEGLQAEMLRNEMDEVLSKVDHLFALTMSNSVYGTLSSLNREDFKEPMTEELKQRLFYLENIGYIEFKSKEPLENVENLQSHIKVTDTGKAFLNLRLRVIERETTTNLIK